jgi:hypothetical protein
MEFSLLEATRSANGEYKYDEILYFMTLDSWAQEANTFNCISYNWNLSPLKKGNFGYDNLIVSLGYTLINCKKFTEENIENIANLIHEGWIINYTYWRDNEPWLNNTVYKYYRPFVSLGDERRNNCAELEYYQLPQEEKDKDRILAKFLINKMNEIYEQIV